MVNKIMTVVRLNSIKAYYNATLMMARSCTIPPNKLINFEVYSRYYWYNFKINRTINIITYYNIFFFLLIIIFFLYTILDELPDFAHENKPYLYVRLSYYRKIKIKL
jgi:hypothetical protein